MRGRPDGAPSPRRQILPLHDLANETADGSPFDEDGWMAEEIPFNAAQRTWERADVRVCGTPESPCDPSTEIVIAGPQPDPPE